MDLQARRLAKSAIGAMLYFSECSRANCRLILWWTARSGRARWNGLIASPCGTSHGQRISTIRFQRAMDGSKPDYEWIPSGSARRWKNGSTAVGSAREKLFALKSAKFSGGVNIRLNGDILKKEESNRILRMTGALQRSSLNRFDPSLLF